MWNDVKGDLLGKLRNRRRIVHERALGLTKQLVHAIFPRTRHRLIRRNYNTLDLEQIMQRLQGHYHLCSGTVRVRDNATTRLLQRFSIHFRHNQRNARLHTEMGRIIDHDTTRCRSLRRIHGRNLTARREERNIPALEVKRLKILNLENLLVSKGNFFPDRARRRERHNLVHREIPFRQNA